MNLEQFNKDQQERIRRHLDKYKVGQIASPLPEMEDAGTEVLYIYADTLKEAKAIEETATLLGHYSEFIPSCGCIHDCCACTFSGHRTLKRVDQGHFIAIHTFYINV